MTSVSMIAPYAPQVPAAVGLDGHLSSAQILQPMTDTTHNPNAGTASDQSGTGAGNGTGTGGALTATLLDRARSADTPTNASPKSVVEAQANTNETAKYLAEQHEELTEARTTAREEALKAQEAAEELKSEAQEEFDFPNPLPTAPILKGDED